MESSATFVSEGYLEMSRHLHKRRKGFGADGHKWVYMLVPIIRDINAKSLLDYGCGKGTLWKELNRVQEYGVCKGMSYYGYDPCIEGKDKPPRGQFDLITCTDVLEHVEPQYLSAVLLHIRSLASKAIFFNINIHEAVTILPDGRNAHLIIANTEWWHNTLNLAFGNDWYIRELPTKRPQKDYVVLLERV